MYPKIVKQILMMKSTPQPRSKSTPTGGRITAHTNLQHSPHVTISGFQEQIFKRNAITDYSDEMFITIQLS